MPMIETYSELVERIQQLSFDEKLELRSLIDLYLIEERREEIARNAEASQREDRDGHLTFSSDLESLRAMLEE